LPQSGGIRVFALTHSRRNVVSRHLPDALDRCPHGFTGHVVHPIHSIVQRYPWLISFSLDRYKPNAAILQNDFIVEGEQRYWVHVAIDRFTGQVIAKQIEIVNE
jgi:hypothetical protein